MEDEVTFLFQLGVIRDAVSTPAHLLTLAHLKDLAVRFLHEKIPDNGLNRLEDRILLFRHEYTSPNVLQLINSAGDVTDETLIEIVLTHNPSICDFGVPTECVPRPHTLTVHSFKAPTFCDFCGEMLFGLVRQGLKCEGCSQNYHKRCAVKVPPSCTVSAPRPASRPVDDSLVSNGGGNGGGGGGGGRSTRSHSRSTSSLPINNNLRIPHTFEVHSYTRPTVCRLCKKLLHGLFKQGLQCRDCHYNTHKKCLPLVPKDCGIELKLDSQSENLDSNSCNSSGSDMLENRDYSDEETSSENTQLGTPSSSSSSPSANIPLMRIVQSVKHTKRKDTQWLKEGWLTHFTNTDKTIRLHYWRLDSQCITLFQSDKGSKYYKEIPLNEILAVDTARQPHSGSEVVHCFSLRLANVDYLVGVEERGGVGGGVPPLESGLGAHVARPWETAIRQALVPHHTTTHYINDTASPSQECCVSSGEGGPYRSEMSAHYNILPEDLLGSGQFGIVYGGTHRATGRPVAIKVIDKLRFPTNQEAQLKNEVAILQNLSHPGVVNLERMFETPERIYVVMEKLKGDMLEMILSHENGRLPERITKFLVAQILIALKHLHEKNIVHCDLKPENVLLSGDDQFPQVKLCDFGFARIIGEKSFRKSVVGTPAYLAPEVIGNLGYNRSLDMWSVGVVVYVALSGTFPFNEDEDIQDQIHNAAFMYPPQPWTLISPDAIDLIHNLLQVKQRKRLSVDKSLSHAWLQTREAWLDLRALEERVGCRYLTHRSDDARYQL